ncbi:hypothetical protein OsJ_06766 [Oryza sativa Japonica Group]|uniref:Uncharacterized protein n=1 Tax=Oryza sativa subsp. japonica TaxID=39947 RepID=A3A6Y3_ORYSJ|nr:hypothetical protein OsJ_06766 [Oryza sativa Japonica Group]BAD21698.1 hypothetical protein [Oryza sativa Japonica Group]BAD21968.1 hypothetical protein [Oryza sativa Japonica Group]
MAVQQEDHGSAGWCVDSNVRTDGGRSCDTVWTADSGIDGRWCRSPDEIQHRGAVRECDESVKVNCRLAPEKYRWGYARSPQD